MTSNREHISVVWFKRDLRLHDNEAINNALISGNRVLFVYMFEEILLNSPFYSERHWNFIKESLSDLNTRLLTYNTEILVVESDVISVFNQLQNHFKITNVFSHLETGILTTFERDKTFKRYCKNNFISWIENSNNGVQRGLKNRETWFEDWSNYMSQPQIDFSPEVSQLLSINEIEKLKPFFKHSSLKTKTNTSFQKGGSTMAYKYADSFFNERYKNYMFHISKPKQSRYSCSRLSPYLSWGNISVREVYQKAQETKKLTNAKHHLSAFASRLRWQAHFIQKFEMEHIMEKVSVNKGYHKLKKSISKDYQKAWREGQTGFPLVDASMRCLVETGYVNFRMRAMLVSFFTHILWQPWQEASVYLSQVFLDFEPGIHFPQIQMQAGETGINNLRIYNPIKNGKEHDPDAEFIKKWVPELAHLDVQFIHEPYLMTELEQQFYHFKLGVNYPYPIVDISIKRKKATEVLWGMKKDKAVLKENKRILSKHTIRNRSKMLNSD